MVVVVIVVRLVYAAEFRRRFEPLDEILLPSPVGETRVAVSMATTAGMVYAPVLRKSMLVILGLLIAFIAGVQVPLAAFIAACALLITRRIKSQKILLLVDWQLLVMFCGLFVVTGTLEVTGVSQRLFALVSELAYAGVAPLTLVTAILSNTISNVPAVLLFRPLIPQFPDPTLAWLTLAAASTLAGNLTLIGSVANLIVAEQALKVGVRLTFMEYLRAGVIITIVTLLIAVAWLSI
jgi:Na+/H+ antiporter NhaD/arsenite permease-like protein